MCDGPDGDQDRWATAPKGTGKQTGELLACCGAVADRRAKVLGLTVLNKIVPERFGR